jgi:hypothetical protein
MRAHARACVFSFFFPSAVLDGSDFVGGMERVGSVRSACGVARRRRGGCVFMYRMLRGCSRARGIRIMRQFSGVCHGKWRRRWCDLSCLPSPLLRSKPRRISSYVAVYDVRFPVQARHVQDTCKIGIEANLQKHARTCKSGSCIDVAQLFVSFCARIRVFVHLAAVNVCSACMCLRVRV